jgi:diguanylate cyclase (GGDEF)-like protein
MTPQQLTAILIVPLLLNLVLLASMVTYAIRQRSLGIASHFSGLCLCLVIWNVGFIMEIISPSLRWKIFFSNASLTAIELLPPSLFALAAMQAGLYPRLKRYLWLTLALPIITILVIWSDDFHHLFRSTSVLSSYNGYLYLNSQYGLWYYWIHLPVAYILLGLSLVMMFWALPHQQPIYRKQTWAMIASLVFPYAVSIATSLEIIPLPYYDLTPSMLTLSCLIIAYALFNFRFLRVVPLARDLVFEQMSDGVLVLDSRHILVDINQAAYQIMNLSIGDTAHNILALFKPDQMPETTNQVQISIGKEPDERHYNARITAVRDKENALLGWVVLLHDNTETLRLLEKLQYMATIDAITEIYNRRYFMQILNDEWARARRYDTMMALVMMDLDHFKNVNDTYGHLAGDAVLKEVTQLCRQNLRDVDKMGRFGGEEFTMLLPETDLEGARATAERLRLLIAGHVVRFRGMEISVTVSMGVAELPPDREATSVTRFLKAADDALYVAKRSGRNCVATSKDSKPVDTSLQG